MTDYFDPEPQVPEVSYRDIVLARYPDARCVIDETREHRQDFTIFDGANAVGATAFVEGRAWQYAAERLKMNGESHEYPPVALMKG